MRSGHPSSLADALKRLKRRHISPWSNPLIPYRRATFAGLHVSYKTHLDGGGRSFGQDFIPLLKRWGMTKQPRAFEWCAGPGFIGFSLLAHGLCDTLCLADINPEAVAACRRTIAENGLDGRVAAYCSDNLQSIPASEHWDLVVANPPHFVAGDPRNLRAVDPDWRVHREFFHTVTPFLKPSGIIVLQENNAGSTVETFRAMIEQSGLAVIFVQGGLPIQTAVHQFYYVGIMRAGDTPPPWATFQT